MPGQFIRVYQDGTAMKLPAGTTLVFQMHYTTYGKATTDRTRIAVKYAKQPPTTQLRWASLLNGTLHIPAGARDHRVDAEMTIGAGHHAVEHAAAHARPRQALDLRRDLPRRPQGNAAVGAELRLQLADRLRLQAAAEAAEGHDASRHRVVRQLDGEQVEPDPTKDVWWGDQTWEEMMFTGLTFSIDPAKASPTAGQQ